jgi:valyl-tRNA synthetase
LGAEKVRVTKELEKAAAEIAKVEQKLNNPAFVSKVPFQVLQEHQKRLADWQAKHGHLQKMLEGLG